MKGECKDEDKSRISEMSNTKFLNALIQQKEKNYLKKKRKESNFVTWKDSVTIKSFNEAGKTFLISTYVRALNRLVLHKAICESTLSNALIMFGLNLRHNIKSNNP